MTLLEIAGLTVGYDGISVVHGVDLRVDAGEVVALVGPNGAGKTTTLLALSGLLRPDSGEISFDGKRIDGLPAHQIARLGIAHVPEDRSLFFGLTVAQNLRLASSGNGIAEGVELFPELEPLLSRRAALLSGGEQQMLAIARGLVTRPRVVIVDEMSLGLAPVIVSRLLPVIRDVSAMRGVGVLMVEQHVHLALTNADRAYVMSRGRIVLEGTGEELARSRDLVESSYLGSALP